MVLAATPPNLRRGVVTEEILDLSAPEGGFAPAPNVQGAPVPNDEVLENITKSVAIDAPMFKKRPKHDGIAVYIGAGPSMPLFIEDIRQAKKDGKYIITSNMTNDWLVERDVVPDAVLIIDPKERVSGYIMNPQKETQFFIGTVCNVGVAKGLIQKGMKVEKLLVAYGIDDEIDIDLQKELYPGEIEFLVGGTMTGLRVLNFAIQLGFQTIEMYGLDSSYGAEPPKLVSIDDPMYDEAVLSNGGAFYEDPQTNKKYAILDPPEGGWFYAYKKKHHGEIQIAKCPDGRMFWTSPVFAHQAKQFIKWYNRFEDKLKIVLHGDNLTNHLLQCNLKSLEQRKALIGDKKWSDKYHPMFCEFFDKNDHKKENDQVDVMIKTGAYFLSQSLNREVTLLDYDYSMLQGKEPLENVYDIVHTTNLMEHIEPECVDNVLKHIKKLARYMVIVHISLAEAEQLLSNGYDAHLLHKSGQWWFNRMENYFTIIEGAWQGGGFATFVCQTLDAKEHEQKEIKRKEVNNG